jgi:hypothetical protein
MQGCIFWSFGKAVFKAPNHNRKIVWGDFNAKVAKEYGYAPNFRKYSLHEEKNDNGRRMIDFSTAMSMAVSSILFQQRSMHLEMWRSPDVLSVNQIDLVTSDSHHTTDIIDVKSCRGAHHDSKNYMEKVQL